MLKRRRWLGLALALSLPPGIAQAQDELVIFAAASLKNALDEIADRLVQGHRQARAQDLLCRELGARQADRAGRAGRPVHLGRSRLDGLCRRQEPDQGRHPRQPARQQDRADRAQGFARSRVAIKQGFDLAKALAGGKLAMANVDARAGRQVRQGGAREARRLGRREGPARAGRECARGARCWWRAARRRSASSTRPTPRPSPTSRSSAPSPRTRHPPIIYPAAVTKEAKNRRRQGVPRLPAAAPRRGRPSRSRASRSW